MEAAGQGTSSLGGGQARPSATEQESNLWLVVRDFVDGTRGMGEEMKIFFQLLSSSPLGTA